MLWIKALVINYSRRRFALLHVCNLHLLCVNYGRPDFGFTERCFRQLSLMEWRFTSWKSSLTCSNQAFKDTICLSASLGVSRSYRSGWASPYCAPCDGIKLWVTRGSLFATSILPFSAAMHSLDSICSRMLKILTWQIWQEFAKVTSQLGTWKCLMCQS